LSQVEAPTSGSPRQSSFRIVGGMTSLVQVFPPSAVRQTLLELPTARPTRPGADWKAMSLKMIPGARPAPMPAWNAPASR
jgi:hypothetical protein